MWHRQSSSCGKARVESSRVDLVAPAAKRAKRFVRQSLWQHVLPVAMTRGRQGLQGRRGDCGGCCEGWLNGTGTGGCALAGALSLPFSFQKLSSTDLLIASLSVALSLSRQRSLTCCWLKRNNGTFVLRLMHVLVCVCACVGAQKLVALRFAFDFRLCAMRLRALGKFFTNFHFQFFSRLF